MIGTLKKVMIISFHILSGDVCSSSPNVWCYRSC